MSKIFLFSTHFSPHGKGIIQVNDYNPKSESKVLNLPDLCIKHSINPCVVVDTSMAGIQAIYKVLSAVNIQLIFGLSLAFVSDATDKNEGSNQSSHKNILFAPDEESYKRLIKISTKSHVDFFHEIPRIDYNYFHEAIKGSKITLAVPFYSSFLTRNAMTQNQCVPDFRQIKPTFFVEDNELPWDGPLERLVRSYAASNGCEVVEAQTVLYERREQALAYQARRLMNRSQGKANTIERPQLNHWGSNAFCLEK